MQDEAVLAERYLDGTIDALDLLLCANSCTPAEPPEHTQRQESEGVPKMASEASTSPSGAVLRAASSSAPQQDAQNCESCACGMPAGIPRRNAGQLTYDEFVLHYMAPNRPVMIQVGSDLSGPLPPCHAIRMSIPAVLLTVTQTCNHHQLHDCKWRPLWCQCRV